MVPRPPGPWPPRLLLALALTLNSGLAAAGPDHALEVDEDGPSLFRDDYVHVGYRFTLMRQNMHREGQGELWLDFEYGLPRIRLRGRANSPRFGEGDINLIIDAGRQVMYVMLKLGKLHEVQCLSYPFPSPEENPQRMRTLQWRMAQIERWKSTEDAKWGFGQLMAVQWTNSVHLDFLLANSGKDLIGVDLRHQDRVVKTVRLNDTAETAGSVPEDAKALFEPPAGCRPAATVKDPMAKVELTPPYSKSSALNDLLLVLSDYAKKPWPRIFVVLQAVTLPGDVAILIEDPAPPDLQELSTVAFDYTAEVFSLGDALAFNDPARDLKPPEGNRHTSSGSIWLNLKEREFRLQGMAKATKVGPLTMDLVAQGVASKVYANIQLELQQEQQCVAYDYPEPPAEMFQELEIISQQALAFLGLSEVRGEDCGIFVAPLSGSRWIHIYVDMESDRPGAILRSEVHKSGRMLRSVEVMGWHSGENISRNVKPQPSWGCAEVASEGAQLARLGLRQPHLWSMELQDALHAVLRMEQSSAVLEILALVGDVAIMVHEPEAPELWKLPEASFLYTLRLGDGQPGSLEPFTTGTFAADFQDDQFRLIAGSAAAGVANISVVLTEGTVAVFVNDPSLDGPRCLTLPMEDSPQCDAATLSLPCGRMGVGLCGRTTEEGYACKEPRCHGACTALFGAGEGLSCSDPSRRAPYGIPCTAQPDACLSCSFACMASCEDAELGQATCIATLYGDDSFGGWAASFPEGSHGGEQFALQGAVAAQGSSLVVVGQGCVATLFREENFRGGDASFAEGAYQADALYAKQMNDAARSIFVERQSLLLVHGSVDVRFVQRTLVDGVTAWTNRPYSYCKVPPDLVGAILFAGPYAGVPAGNLTFISPRDGMAFIWGEVGAVQQLPGSDWEQLGWEPVGQMPYDAGDGDLRPVDIFRRQVLAAAPVSLVVPGTWVGGVAFKDEGRPPPQHPAGYSSGPAKVSGAFDGLEEIGGRECNRFSFMGFGDAELDDQIPSIQLWYSKQDEALCKLQVMPALGPGKPEAGAVVDILGWSTTLFPGPISAADTDLAEDRSSWLKEGPSSGLCKAAASVDNPWVWLGASSVATSLPTATAITKLAEAAAAVGLLPAPATHVLSRLVITSPRDTTSTSTAPPPKPVDIFGPDLESFSFSFVSIHNSGTPGAAPRRGSGELRVDLRNQRLYLRTKGRNVSAGIPWVESHIVFCGEKNRLYVRTRVTTTGIIEPYEQCWSVNAERTVPGLPKGIPVNPFLQARAAGRGADRVAIDVWPGKRRMEVHVDSDNALLGLSISDLRGDPVTSIEVQGWATTPVDPGWFEPGTEDCPDLFFLEHVKSIGVWELLSIFFPPVDVAAWDVGAVGVVPAGVRDYGARGRRLFAA